MKIIVNAEPRDITATDLAAMLEELGFLSPAIATAVNGQFVPASTRGNATLNEGDKVEILSPMQGG